MSINIISEASQELLKTQNLCAWLKLYSVIIWNKLGFARNRGFVRINETTVTQNLVFDFWIAAAGTNFPIEIYESTDETANGSDLEILLETNKGFLFLPSQAKVLYKNNRYNSINHKVGNEEQVDLLINYAKQYKGIPLYLLYNYYDNHKKWQSIESVSGFPIDYFGCSTIFAQYIKNEYCYKRVTRTGKRKWQIPTFDDLHPKPAIPFHNLVCSFQNDDNNTWINNLVFRNEYQLQYYNRDEFMNKNSWKDLAPPPRIGFIKPEKSTRLLDISDSTQTYNPKYRIVFPKEKRQTTIMRYIG